MKTPFLLLCSVSLFSFSPLWGGEAFFFRDGDRAALVGDSITEARHYSTLIESYTLSRFPDWKITFRHVGWSGDTMNLRGRGGIQSGYARDFAYLNPTAVTICYGMNDARARDKGVGRYAQSAAELADLFSADGARLTFISSSPEEDYDAGEPAGSAYNRVLRSYTDTLAKVAKEKGIPFIDQLDPMIEVIEKGRASGVFSTERGGPRLVPDRVHPNPNGGFVTAAIVLEGLGAPALVSRVEIDAASEKATAERAVVSELSVGEKGIEFTRKDEAMPWPVRANMLLATKVPGFNPLDKLSLYELKVTNLPAAQYYVAIGDKRIGKFTREELTAGVNLSAQAAAAMPEVEALYGAINKKNTLFHTLWREVRLSKVPAWLPEEVIEGARAKEMERLEAELSKAQEAITPLRQPQPHRWRLTPAS